MSRNLKQIDKWSTSRVCHHTHIFTIKPEPNLRNCEQVRFGWVQCSVSKIKIIILKEKIIIFKCIDRAHNCFDRN